MKGKYVFRRILWGLLLVFIFGGSVFAQQKKLTINLKNGSFAQLTDQIKKQSDYTFFFNNAMVMSLKKITIQVKEVTLDSVLNIALKGSDLTYKIKDKTVILYAKETPEAASKTVKLQGQVNDEAGEALPGVNVFIKGTTVGTVTDLDGNYSLVVPDVMGMEVVFTFIGKKTKEIKYTGDRFMNVMLKDSYNEMDEVQVRARANVNEIDVRAKTGVVNEVDVRRMNNKPVLDMALALQGMAPGLIVTNKGDLGSKPEIRIRGTSSLREGDAANEPLYVLDGQVISSDAFLTLNPNDIKEIKVLKDAAACALYGIKAANGVLEITSQRGTAGKMVYNYSFSGGVTLRGRRGVDMMNSKEKLELERRLENTATPGYRYSEDYYRKYHANDPNLESLIARGQQVLDSLSRINTDWFKELLRNNFYQEHNLSARGGTEQTSFYASLNYSQQGGRIPGNDIKRVTARLSVDQEITPKLYASLSVNGGYSLTNTPNGTSYSPTDLVYQLNPYETKDVNAELVSFPGRTYADLFNQYSEESSDKRAGVSGSINFRGIEGLEIAAVAGIDYVLSEKLGITPPTAYSEITSGVPERERGKLTKDKNTTMNLSSNVRVTYNRAFGKHDLTLGANFDFYSDHYDNLGITGYGLTKKMQSASGVNQSIEGNRKPSFTSKNEKTAQLGIGVLAGYSWNNIYDLFGTYKSDASSILPSDKRWNSAWAVGAGWSLKNYPFLRDNGVLTELKLRASYGCTASLQGVSPSSAVATFQYSEDAYGDDQLLSLMGLYNADLKPEQTIDIDAGISLGLWNRVTLNAGWYRRRTKDALLDVPIPASNGFTTLKRNIGILENSGIEGELYVKMVDRNNWRMSGRLNLAYNQNKVVDLYHTDCLYTSEYDMVPSFEEGKSYDMIYGPVSLGINPMTGLPVFRGADGREIAATEKLTREDMVALGHSTPPYSGSFFYSVSYGNFDLDMDFYFVFGGKKAYSFSYVREVSNANYNAIKGQVENMWFQEGDDNKIYHRPYYSSAAVDNLKLYANSRTVGSSDYLRMSSLSLRYRLPYWLIEKTKNVIQYASVAFQASNLFTLTRYKESDPESGSLVGTQQPVFTLNLSVSF